MSLTALDAAITPATPFPYAYRKATGGASMKPAEELEQVKNLIRCLKGEGPVRMFIKDGAGNDLTSRELPLLERELDYLETVIARAKKNV